MIEIINASPEHGGTPKSRSSLVAALSKTGLNCVITDQPSGDHIALCFAEVESGLVQGLSPATRARVVLVAEGDGPDPEQADAERQKLGLLGLIEPDAWMNWKRGLLVAWGLYGRSDVATGADLVSKGKIGLQPAHDREALPPMLARFLKHAEEILLTDAKDEDR